MRGGYRTPISSAEPSGGTGLHFFHRPSWKNLKAADKISSGRRLLLLLELGVDHIILLPATRRLTLVAAACRLSGSARTGARGASGGLVSFLRHLVRCLEERVGRGFDGFHVAASESVLHRLDLPFQIALHSGGH